MLVEEFGYALDDNSTYSSRSPDLIVKSVSKGTAIELDPQYVKAYYRFVLLP